VIVRLSLAAQIDCCLRTNCGLQASNCGFQAVTPALPNSGRQCGGETAILALTVNICDQCATRQRHGLTLARPRGSRARGADRRVENRRGGPPNKGTCSRLATRVPGAILLKLTWLSGASRGSDGHAGVVDAERAAGNGLILGGALAVLHAGSQDVRDRLRTGLDRPSEGRRKRGCLRGSPNHLPRIFQRCWPNTT
jgi:hypothetical protein